MKIKSRHLFYILTFFSFALGTFGWFTVDHTDPDVAFVFIYSKYSFFVFVLSLFTSTVYFYMYKTHTPIDDRIGLLHFTLITIGVVLSINLYFLYNRLVSSGAPDTIAIATDGIVRLVIGPLFLLGGLAVFIYGLVKAFGDKTNAY